MSKNDKLVEEKLRTAVVRGAELLIDNGLGDWKIKLNNKRSILAETWHEDKSISFSKHFLIIADKEQLEGVTLHEVAHALLGKGYGHGKEFVDKCKEISPNSDYAVAKTSLSTRKYIATCPGCKYSGTYSIKRTLFCGLCFKKGITSQFKMTENKLKVKEW